MNEEDRIRIERGKPESLGEAVTAIIFFLGVISLLVLIVCGAF